MILESNVFDNYIQYYLQPPFFKNQYQISDIVKLLIPGADINRLFFDMMTKFRGKYK